MIYPGFVGPAYVSQSPLAANEALINWYPERVEVPNGRNSAVFYPTPGYTAFATLTGSPGRAIFSQAGETFAVAGSAFDQIASDGTVTNRGTVADTGQPATICSNGDGGRQLFITSGGKGYCYDLDTQTLSLELAASTMGAFLDGYFISLDALTSTLRISDLNDGTSWPAASVIQRTAGSDPWRAMTVCRRLIWLWGEQTSEVWWNVGSSPIPFQPIQEAFMQQGIAATFAFAVNDQTVQWLSSSTQGQGIVLQAQGYQPTRLSTHAVETAINGYAVIHDALGWSYQEEGHSFFLLNFPTAGITWATDPASGLWHQRGWWNTVTAAFEASRVAGHAFAFGAHLVVDTQSGTVWTQSLSEYLDMDDAAIRRVRRPPTLCDERHRIYVSLLELDFETGLGMQTGQGADPQVTLRRSYDGGKTWGSELSTGAGAIGRYGTRVRFNRCGSGRQWQPEIAVSDPIPWRLLNAYVTTEAGTS